jgi:hypothetical protein
MSAIVLELAKEKLLSSGIFAVLALRAVFDQF